MKLWAELFAEDDVAIVAAAVKALIAGDEKGFPPHLVRAGESSWTAKKYGVLSETWPQDIHKGFAECMRVLKPGGTLIFKWNEDQIKLRAVLDAIGEQPLFGDRRSKTHWLVFMKPTPEEGEQNV